VENSLLLNTPRNLTKRLSSAPGKRLPADFRQAVAMLKRPYYRLDEAAYQAVTAIAGDSDIVLLDGKQMTFGDADGGKALMPLAKDI
jgi:hypothetical protein